MTGALSASMVSPSQSESFYLYGLRVLRASAGAVLHSTRYEVLWQHAQVDAPVGNASPRIFSSVEGAEVYTVHHYGMPGEASCEFRIAADGTRVLSRALPKVSDHDLFGLFAEPVMRSVLKLRGLTSFHGAALERNGISILLLGEKGAGKSTLSAMLVRDGWSLLTDDLARVLFLENRWAVAPGFRQLKLHPDVVRLLGFSGSTAQLRWSSIEAPNDPHLNKSVLHFDGGAHAVPLRTIYVVGPRGMGGNAVHVAAAHPVAALRSLVIHLTDDPAAPGAPPARQCVQDSSDIVRRIPVKIVSMPEGIRPGHNLTAFHE